MVIVQGHFVREAAFLMVQKSQFIRPWITYAFLYHHHNLLWWWGGL